jgi:hypothetical protein
MWEVWLAGSIVLCIVVIAMLSHERSVKRRFEEAQAELRENRAMDQKIVRLYKEIEEMLDNFEAYVGEVHEDLEAQRNELLTMSRQATTLYMQVMQPGVFAPKPAPEPQPEPRPAEEPARAERRENPPPADDGKPPSRLSPRHRTELGRISGKGQKIRYLTGKGLTMSEIARELDIGKGEIRLILDLDKD